MPNAPWGPITREGRNEFQVLVAIISFYAGFSQIVLGDVSNSIAQLDPIVQFLWNWFLMVGGALTLISTIWKRADEGLPPYLEVAGLLLISGALFTFGIAVIATIDRPASTFGAPLSLALGFACLSRCVRVIHALIPNGSNRMADLKREVQRQLAEEAARQADEIVETGRVTNTGPLPIINTNKDDEKGGPRT